LSDKISTVSWLKDNKPLDDRMADRISKRQVDANTFELEVKHCRESDSGLYTARAINGTETATCSAQLVCETCKNYAVCKRF
jgi:Immunoglobulin I-set domain